MFFNKSTFLKNRAYYGGVFSIIDMNKNYSSINVSNSKCDYNYGVQGGIYYCKYCMINTSETTYSNT